MTSLISAAFGRHCVMTSRCDVSAAFVPALCLAVVTYVGCQTALAVFLLTIATGAIGSMYSGFLSNHISIAPAFAGQRTGGVL